MRAACYRGQVCSIARALELQQDLGIARAAPFG
jgi:hypothetical protein